MMSKARLKLFVICINQKTRFLLKSNQVIHIILLLHQFECCSSRSSHLEVFYKISVLKNVTKYTEKDLCWSLCWSLFFNKVADLRSATLTKKETPTQFFSCEFCDIFKKTFFREHFRWLVLSINYGKIWTTIRLSSNS